VNIRKIMDVLLESVISKSVPAASVACAPRALTRARGRCACEAMLQIPNWCALRCARRTQRCRALHQQSRMCARCNLATCRPRAVARPKCIAQCAPRLVTRQMSASATCSAPQLLARWSWWPALPQTLPLRARQLRAPDLQRRPWLSADAIHIRHRRRAPSFSRLQFQR
jgi:hypothetical protein